MTISFYLILFAALEYHSDNLFPYAKGADCFSTTFPRLFGGTSQGVRIENFDINSKGDIIAAGRSNDNTFVNFTTYGYTNDVPILVYVVNGNYYQWGYSLRSTDNKYITYVRDAKFSPNGNKIAIAIDEWSIVIPWSILIFNSADGSLHGSFREEVTKMSAYFQQDSIYLADDLSVYMTMTTKGSNSKFQWNVARFTAS